MVSLTSIVFLVLLGSTVSGLPWKKSNPKLECPSVYDKPCTSDWQCPCRSSTRLICNFAHVCHEISMVDIDRRQRCPNIFKSKCNSNADCRGCRGMVCAQKECVFDKNKSI